MFPYILLIKQRNYQLWPATWPAIWPASLTPARSRQAHAAGAPYFSAQCHFRQSSSHNVISPASNRRGTNLRRTSAVLADHDGTSQGVQALIGGLPLIVQKFPNLAVEGVFSSHGLLLVAGG